VNPQPENADRSERLVRFGRETIHYMYINRYS
jgi:hypothetical protein